MKSLRDFADLENRIRGWLPKEPVRAYQTETSKQRWRKTSWIVFAVVFFAVIVFAVYVGTQSWLRYSNPRLDVTASYFEKTLNASTASFGDVVEVDVMVYWHGYMMPEFKREVQIVDPFQEDSFELVGGSNTYSENSIYGTSFQLEYSLRVVCDQATTVELPKPRLHLDSVEIPLSGPEPVLRLQPSGTGG